ncbi:MAG: hypothetical protein PVJ66_10200 [Gammaproteobacteria bacterium]|jgi:hypothetical protein
MKSKTGVQIVQAVLVMLAIICGMLLLPGNEVRSASECTTHNEVETGPLAGWLQPLFTGDCEPRRGQ